MVSGVVPNVLAALIGCLLLGLLRCIDFESAYRSIHWQSLVLIVGMMIVPVPPFLLDPIDFAGVYAARKAQQEPGVGHA